MLTEKDVLFAPKARLIEPPPNDEAAKLLEKIHGAMVAECRRKITRLVNELYGHRLSAVEALRLKVPFALSPRLDLELPEKTDIDAYAAQHADELYGQIEGNVREALSKQFDTIDQRHYAFIFSGKDDYGRTAEAYVRQWLPGHRLGWASTFEDMFEQIAAELAADRRSGRPVRISEIVVITHGYAGGLLIPLTKEDRKKEDAFRQWRREHPNDDPSQYDWKKRGHFSPEYLALVQKDQTKATAALRRARRDVLAALDERAQIVVRGCNFGQSSEGLRALRDFFGGHVETAAPVGYQGFETTYVRADHPVPELRTEAGAYDFLVQHGYLEGDPDLSVKQKEEIIRRRFGRPPLIPAEFFTFGQQAYKAEKAALEKLPRSQRSAFAPQLDPYVVTPAEIKDYKPLEPASEEERQIRDPQPRLGRVWGTASRTGRVDAELDDLSWKDLLARAQKLQNPYLPANAAMLLRLYRVWERKRTIWSWDPRENKNDPLFGIRDEEEFFPHRKRFEADAALAPTPVEGDRFEKGTLKYRTRDESERASAEQAGASTAAQVAAIVSPAAAAAATERDFDARGRVENLPDGGLRLWNFAVNSAELRPQFKQPLLQLAKGVAGKADVRLTIDGHTSSSGDEGRNEGLAASRAQQVVALLQTAGVSPSAMTPTGYGEGRLLVQERKGGTLIPRNMAQNRRVEIRLVKATAQPSTTGTAPKAHDPAKTGKVGPGPAPITLIDAVELKRDIKIPGSWRGKAGVLQVVVEGKITLQGKIGLRDASKTLKLTPDQKKAAFEAAFQSDLGELKVAGEVKDGKASQIKVGLDVTDWLTVDFAANSDFTKPFQLDVKSKPVDVTYPAGDWAFRGRVYVTLTLYFGPDPKVVGSLVARGGRAIVRVAARAGVAAHGLLFTELGTVTVVGAVAIGVGVGAAAVTWLGFVLYMIGDAHREGRWLAVARVFANGYSRILNELTSYEDVVNKLSKDKVARLLSIDWKAEMKVKVKRWVDDEDEAALNRMDDLGEAAAAQDYHTYVTLYGDEQWRKLAAAHRKKYGENSYRGRTDKYWRIVRDQLKERKDTFGVPLEVNP